jgi:hypothetical protein
MRATIVLVLSVWLVGGCDGRRVTVQADGGGDSEAAERCTGACNDGDVCTLAEGVPCFNEARCINGEWITFADECGAGYMFCSSGESPCSKPNPEPQCEGAANGLCCPLAGCPADGGTALDAGSD